MFKNMIFFNAKFINQVTLNVQNVLNLKSHNMLVRMKINVNVRDAKTVTNL